MKFSQIFSGWLLCIGLVFSLSSCTMDSQLELLPDGQLTEDSSINFRELFNNKNKLGKMMRKAAADSITSKLPTDSLAKLENEFAEGFIAGFSSVYEDIPTTYTPFQQTSLFQKNLGEVDNPPLQSLAKVFVKKLEENGQFVGVAFQRRNLTQADQNALEEVLGSKSDISSTAKQQWDGKTLRIDLQLKNPNQENLVDFSDLFDNFPINMQIRYNFKNKIKNIQAATPTPYLKQTSPYQVELQLNSQLFKEVFQGKYSDSFTISTE